jgi:transposase-like protein
MGTIKLKEVGCNKCGAVHSQIKKGKTPSGSQRLFCKVCRNKYTPVKKGYDEETRKLAVRAYMAGNSARKVGKMFGMDGNTVTAWVIFFRGGSAIRPCRRSPAN